MLHRTFCIAIVILSMLTSCTSVRKTIESGNYDRAIDLSIGKLKGKKHKKEEQVKNLELAFAKANNRDFGVINNLLSEGNPKHWERVNAMYRKIQDRQAKVTPLLPLVAKTGYKANFKIEDISAYERNSRNNAAQFAFQNANKLLQKAENGDRIAARQAYDEYWKAKNFGTPIDGLEAGIEKAKMLGTTHILVDVTNNSNAVLTREFYNRMMNMSTRDLASAWLEYHFTDERPRQYDYKVLIKLNTIDVSPERVNTREYVEENKVEDGWDYILDAKGNVKKDSAGNDMKQKKYTVVKAFVKEVFQSKAAIVSGDVEIIDFYKNNLLERERLSTEVVFENYASTFTGDKRALTEATRKRIGNAPMAFPSNNNMLIDAAEKLKPMIREKLKNSKMII